MARAVRARREFRAAWPRFLTRKNWSGRGKNHEPYPRGRTCVVFRGVGGGTGGGAGSGEAWRARRRRSGGAELPSRRRVREAASRGRPSASACRSPRGLAADDLSTNQSAQLLKCRIGRRLLRRAPALAPRRARARSSRLLAPPAAKPTRRERQAVAPPGRATRDKRGNRTPIGAGRMAATAISAAILFLQGSRGIRGGLARRNIKPAYLIAHVM